MNDDEYVAPITVAEAKKARAGAQAKWELKFKECEDALVALKIMLALFY